MTHTEFTTLAENEQALLTWFNGTYLAQYFDGTFTIILFQVEGFYVEVYYHRKNKEVYRYHNFSNVEKLDPYLDKIDISGIFN